GDDGQPGTDSGPRGEPIPWPGDPGLLADTQVVIVPPVAPPPRPRVEPRSLDPDAQKPQPRPRRRPTPILIGGGLVSILGFVLLFGLPRSPGGLTAATEPPVLAGSAGPSTPSIVTTAPTAAPAAPPATASVATAASEAIASAAGTSAAVPGQSPTS